LTKYQKNNRIKELEIGMKQYYRIMLGPKSKYSDECYKGSFIGADYGINENLMENLPDNWKDFNLKYIPVYLSIHPEKTKVGAGLSCGQLWRICKGIRIGDTILSPDGFGSYYIGEVISNYYFKKNEVLQHSREVKWMSNKIERINMSEELKYSTGSIGTVSDITKYSKEIEAFIQGNDKQKIIATDETIEDPSVFAMEKHLEDFLIENWSQTELGKNYDLFVEDGEIIGKQYKTEIGEIDILAISKDKKSILVVELKRGRTSDIVVGQIQRYMGFIKEELAEPDQNVKGIIIALDDDKKIKYALNVTNNIEFYRYQIDFKLFKN
jgi:restriction system protein